MNILISLVVESPLFSKDLETISCAIIIVYIPYLNNLFLLFNKHLLYTQCIQSLELNKWARFKANHIFRIILRAGTRYKTFGAIKRNPGDAGEEFVLEKHFTNSITVKHWNMISLKSGFSQHWPLCSFLVIHPAHSASPCRLLMVQSAFPSGLPAYWCPV